MQETSQTEAGEPIIILNYKYIVFRALMEYLYFDKATVTPLIAVELLQAADEFMLDHLKVFCEKLIIKAIDTNNVVHLLINADCYRARRLRSNCVNYILLNWDSIRQRDEWNSLNRDLLEELTIMNQSQ